MGKSYRKSYLNLDEAKLQNNYLKQVVETLDYVLKTYIPSEACVNLMEAIKYTSRFEEHKRDLEFKEERKDADVMVARKYLYDRKYKLDSVILNEFSREHGKEVDTAIVHLGMYADEYTRSLNALAITIGMDIFFRNGAYRPETEEGRKILAHELIHVAQSKKREEYRGASREELEREAETAEKLFEWQGERTKTVKIENIVYKLSEREYNKFMAELKDRVEEELERKLGRVDEEERLKLLYAYKKMTDKGELPWQQL